MLWIYTHSEILQNNNNTPRTEIQQRFTSSRPLTFQFQVVQEEGGEEVFKVFLDRVFLFFFFLNGPWMQEHGGGITGADIAAWPYSVGILCKFTAFLGTLHWLVATVGMGHFGVSYLEVLIFFEQWAGHWLLSEKVTRPHVRANRLFLIPSVPVSEGKEIRHGCQFVSTLVRALEVWVGSCRVVYWSSHV